MAIADDVKSKIGSLIDTANDKTGKSDSTLTAAVNRLIAGYGQGGGITPAGTIKIIANGDYDVTSYANAEVSIPEVEQALPEIEVGEDGRIVYTIIQKEGYIAGGTSSGTKTQPTQAAKTVTPGAAEKVAVAKGLYTTGDVKVAGDTNLMGENIKKGVSIFGITGVYEATGSNGEVEADDLSGLYCWEKYASGSGQIIETEATGVTLSLYMQTSTENPWDSVDYADEIKLVNGELQLVNPTTIILNSTTRDQIIGKYIFASMDSTFYRIPSDATMLYHPSYGAVTGGTIEASKAYKLTGVAGGDLAGFVVSADSTAYPEDGEQDGYRYVYIGTLENDGSGAVAGQDLYYNARSHGVMGDGVTDDAPALNALVTAVHDAGGGTIWLPKGVYMLDAPILWQSNVSLVGEGVGLAILKTRQAAGVGEGFAAIRGLTFSADDPCVNCAFEQFTIDGEEMQITEYTSWPKGINIHFMSNCVFRDIEIRNTCATGLGVDHLRNSVVDHVVCINCGRSWTGNGVEQNVGGAGIGIGSNCMEGESLIVQNCVADGCGNYGIFFEKQGYHSHS